MSVAKGSSEEPWLLELHYNCPGAGKEGESGEGKPTVLVGKGANSLKFYGENFCSHALICENLTFRLLSIIFLLKIWHLIVIHPSSYQQGRYVYMYML